MSKLSPAEFMRRSREVTPLAATFDFTVETMGDGAARVRAPYRDEFRRHGGTVSGPLQMALADYAMYAAVMSVVEQGELAVTANLNINFLRRPEARDVIAEAQLIRCGKRLAYGEVMLFSDGSPEPVAHVTATYSLPPQSAPVRLKRSFRAG